MVHSFKTQTLATPTNWQSPPWQSSPWWPRRAIAPSLPREVNLPGCPEGGQLWSRSSLTSNQPGRRSRNGKTAALTIPPHPSIIPQTPTQKCRMQPSLSCPPPPPLPFSLCFLPLSFVAPAHLQPESLACSRQRIPAPEWANVNN